MSITLLQPLPSREGSSSRPAKAVVPHRGSAVASIVGSADGGGQDEGGGEESVKGDYILPSTEGTEGRGSLACPGERLRILPRVFAGMRGRT